VSSVDGIACGDFSACFSRASRTEQLGERAVLLYSIICLTKAMLVIDLGVRVEVSHRSPPLYQ